MSMSKFRKKDIGGEGLPSRIEAVKAAAAEGAMSGRRAGLSVVGRIRKNQPAGKWKHLQTRRMTEEELEEHIRGKDGFAVICGPASGGKEGLGAEAIDFDELV